jgi:hypothetical protein
MSSNTNDEEIKSIIVEIAKKVLELLEAITLYLKTINITKANK